MLQTGRNISAKDDPLLKVQVDYLYNAIRNPKPEILAKMRQLRAVCAIDKKQYSNLKKQLPYFVCGIFNPPFRRLENFGWILHFVIDIDNLSEKQWSLRALRERLLADQRIEMLFVSPGGDGLKIMFRLSDKCYDYAKYSLFYKVFLKQFSMLYNIDQVVDSRTSDATRACFISADSDAYFNPSSETVDINRFIDFNDPYVTSAIDKEFREEEKKIEKDNIVSDEEMRCKNLDDDVLLAIKKTLNPSYRVKPQKNIYVPPQLNESVKLVNEKMALLSVVVNEVRDIHYGKKFCFSVGMRKAEINLFYGKRGYSVVISPKAGTDSELNNICARILEELFNSELPPQIKQYEGKG